MDEKQQIAQEINNLTCDLASPVSPIGDWKISKIYEYRMLGKDDPYNFDELAKERQKARDRINELQSMLAEMEQK